MMDWMGVNFLSQLVGLNQLLLFTLLNQTQTPPTCTSSQRQQFNHHSSVSSSFLPYHKMEAAQQYISRYHHHFHQTAQNQNQSSSSLCTHVKAPVDLVWSLVRRFDEPQKYKPFVSRCTVVKGNLEIGSVREVNVKSGLPATTSTERLELLNDEDHILGIRILGGDHRLKNYSSVVTVHPETVDGRPGALVIESFMVDVPEGNTKDETSYFVQALINCNHKSLADVSERMNMLDHHHFTN